MAVRAGYPASHHRMSGPVVLLGALGRVAAETNVRLGSPVEGGILRAMDCVARRARNIGCRMAAGGPVDALASLVAVKTGAALNVGARSPLAAEHEIHGRPGAVLFVVLHVGAARPVASLTTRLSRDAVARLADRHYRLLRVDAMAAGAHGVAARALLGYA